MFFFQFRKKQYLRKKKKHLAKHLEKMTLESLKALFQALGMRVRAFGATSGRSAVMKKVNYIEAIVEHWHQIRKRAIILSNLNSGTNEGSGNVDVFGGKARTTPNDQKVSSWKSLCVWARMILKWLAWICLVGDLLQIWIPWVF